MRNLALAIYFGLDRGGDPEGKVTAGMPEVDQNCGTWENRREISWIQESFQEEARGGNVLILVSLWK